MQGVDISDRIGRGKKINRTSKVGKVINCSARPHIDIKSKYIHEVLIYFPEHKQRVN